MNRSKISYIIKEYFSFSKSERNGIIILLILILLTITATYSISYFIPQTNYHIDASQFRDEILKIEKDSSDTGVVRRKPEQASAYSHIHEQKEIRLTKKKVSVVDINSADSISLEQLPGIGPVFAKRIIKYRDLLGGFYSLEQLSEVYGISRENVDKTKGLLVIDTSLISKLDINSADFKQINAHPYISYEQTKKIFTIRRKGPIESTRQLVDNSIFTHDEMERLKHYILISK